MRRRQSSGPVGAPSPTARALDLISIRLRKRSAEQLSGLLSSQLSGADKFTQSGTKRTYRFSAGITTGGSTPALTQDFRRSNVVYPLEIFVKTIDLTTDDQPETEHTQRLTTARVGRVISRVGKAAGVIVDEGDPRTGRGVKYASAHDLRRTFAVRLKRSGMPPDLIQQLMWHADFRAPQRSITCAIPSRRMPAGFVKYCRL